MLRLGYMSFWAKFVLVLGMLPGLLLLFYSGGAYEAEWELLSLGGVSVSVGVTLDSVSLLFGSCVLFISGAVFLFGQGYMSEEVYSARFTGILLSFVGSMLILIFSSGLVGLLLGWDGLGLSSFLLVVYYQSATSAGGGLVTAITNRIGDVALILGVGGLMFRGDWAFYGDSFSLFSGLMLLLGAITKSAQFPFCAWLPLAMAAPTPVSALVHSSTLVTAGVYMIIRFYGVAGFVDGFQSVLLFLGSVTVAIAGIAALSEFDGKKVVAFSTLSQLGLMVVSLGLGAPMVAFFHLLTHAMFKALLFVCVGISIYFHEHTQDLRGLGNVVKAFPVVRAGVVVAGAALCGLPFLAGFYSKDLILEVGLVAGGGWGFLFFLVGATALTSVYTIRSVFMSQFVEGSQACLLGGKDSTFEFWGAICMLGTGAVFGGAALNWMMLPSVSVSGISVVLGGIPLFILICGVLVGKNMVGLRWIELSGFGTVFSGLWFLSELTCHYSIKTPLWLGSEFLAVVDQGWLEMSSSQGLSAGMGALSSSVRVVSQQPTTVVLLLGIVGVSPLLLYIA